MRMEWNRHGKKIMTWAAFGMAALFCAFFTNAYMPVEWDKFSEGLVIGRLYQLEHEPEINPQGFLVQYGENYDVEYRDLEKRYIEGEPLQHPAFYTHNIGAQGNLLGACDFILQLIGIASPGRRLALYRLGCATLFFLLILYVGRWLMKEFGVVGGIGAVCAALCSEYLVKSAGNLYWQVWSMLLPMVIVIWMCQEKLAAGKISPVKYILLGLSVLLRCMFGFEFLSTILIAMEIPVVYYCLFSFQKIDSHLKEWVAVFLKTAAVALTAFLVSILIWAGLEVLYFGSVQGALEDMLQTVGKRTGAFEYLGDNALIQESLQVSALTVVRGYLFWKPIVAQYTMLRLLMPYGLLVLIDGAWAIHKKNTEEFWKLFRKCMVVGVALLAPISWLVLAKGHAYIHTHIDIILWFIPAVLIMIAHAGELLTNMIKRTNFHDLR